MTSLKRFLTLFFVTILAVSVWGTVITISSSDSWTGGKSGGGAAISITSGDISISITSGYKDSDPKIRWYSGATMTVTSTGGNITKLVFNTGGSNISVPSGGTGTWNSSTNTWTGDNATVTLRSSAQVKWSSVEVTYTSGGGGGGGGGTCATYTVTSKTTVATTGTAPAGSSASYSQTYGTAKQATAGNSFSLTLTGYEGKQIKSIALSAHSNSGGGAGGLSVVVGGSTTIASIASGTSFSNSAWNGSYTNSYTDVTIAMTNDSYTIGSGENVVITIAASANSLFCESYTICWEDGSGSSIATPAFDTEAGEVCAASKTIKVSGYNGSLNYYYTLDGATPTTSSTAYNNTAGIVIAGTPAGNSVTIKMIATDGIETSSVKTATFIVYNVPNTQATAYTPAEAIALYDANPTCLSGTSVYVEGYVSQIVDAYNDTYHNISFNVSADGTTGSTQFEFWRNKYIDGANYSAITAADIEVGDHVIGYGELKYYSGTYEFEAGNYLVLHEKPTPCSDPATALSITNASEVLISNTLELTTTGGNGGPVVWEVSSGTGTATITGTTLTPTSLGTVTVTASQAKYDDKCAGSDFKTITITAAPATVILSEAGAETSVDGLHVDEPYTLPTSSAATCGGKTLVGWSTVTVAATDTKPTTNFYDAGSSVLLGASQKFYAVFAELGAAKEFAFDITPSDFNTTSYAANNGEHISTATATDASGAERDVKWVSNQVYKNSGTMQWQGGNGYIYNSTDLGTVNSVTITENSGNSGTFSTYYGTAAQPSEGSAGSNKGYFKTKVGSSVGKTDNIHVVFTAPSLSNFSTTCCTDVNAPQVTLQIHSTKVIFSWDAQAGATGYNVTIPEASINVDLGSGVTSYTATGLTMTTDYTYTITAKGASCNGAASGAFRTNGPEIDLVEWKENAAVLFIDDAGLDPKVVIDGEVEHGSISGLVATELFFAKYFEGSGSMKLISIFNGTAEKISLAKYKIVDKHANSSNEYGTPTEYPLGSLGDILPGQEIIFFTRPLTTSGAEEMLVDCSETFITSVASKSGAKENPRWIECDGTTFAKLQFNGNDAMLLQKDGANIDVIGARTSLSAIAKNCRNENSWRGTVINMDKDKTAGDFPNISLSGSETYADYGVDMSSATIDIYTARCILFRNKDVTSGAKAVALNTTTFATLGNHTYLGEDYTSEWSGRSVCTSTDRCETLGWTYVSSQDGKTYKDNSAATCNSYEDLGNFDYNSYYKDYDNIEPGKTLSTYDHNDRDEYTIPIADLANYSCLSLKFQLTKAGEVITETPVQVPIIVTSDATTADPLFNEIVKDKITGDAMYDLSISRCRTCNVVVLDGATLTKAADGSLHDVAQVRDLKIYPGGKLEVPSSRNYTVNTLAFRRQEDEISMADIKGGLTVQETDGVYLDLRIDPSNWHYISLPFDCNVKDITFADGEEAQLGKDYLIQWYDGAYRAANKTGGWTDIASNATLKKGLGYIVALPGSGKIRKEIRFPMANGVIADEKTNKDIKYVYAYGGDKTDEQLTPNHKGWNLLGNPYMMYYATDITTPLAVGHLDESGTTYSRSGSLRYLVAPIDNGWSGYEQIAISTHMPPFTSYFVQIGANNTGGDDPTDPKTITFNQTSAGKTSVVARRMEEDETEDTHPVWVGLTLTAPNAEKDNTAMLISNDFTDNYDMMDDLVKMRGSYYTYYNKPILSSQNNEGEMAFNALPDTSAAAGIPINYYAATAGSYTLALDPSYPTEEVKSAMLLDATTNEYYDLLNDSYAFNTAKGNNTNRFKLFVRVERKKPHTPTGFDDINYSETPRKVLINGHVYIQRAGAIYDITGKQVLNF